MPEYPIRLPDIFLDILSGSRCSRLVQQSLEEFSEFIARNEMIFFRQYTDHGTRHIESVMETACALMTESSWKLIKPEDICVLTIATILHDSALHLQEPGFLALLSNTEEPLYPELDSDSWKVLWTKYVSEVSRFSQSQLDEIFGVSNPVKCPDLENENSWTPLQNMYIGEFIRRHHHRLAHEIAFKGIPGAESQFPSRDDSDPLLPLLDLAGLVARSHGMAIRPLLPYLSHHYHLRTVDSSHPVYLMVLLRIADYLQLQSGRAPGCVAKIKRIQSPQSQREWKVHESIKDILYDQNEDPESVEIIVDPNRTSIDVFLRIQEWLHGIQTELDTSWAVLGEVFGRFKEKDLGLTIRRVRSNIDDTKSFGRDAGYVPHRITFSAADAELLKLLVKPLYGDRPEIAVRELLQNAVDAVLERHALAKTEEECRDSDVEIQIKKLDDGKWSLIVEDFGIGMTYDTLSNFFLNAGASFRSTMTWKKQFQSDDGESIVLRSGRFGVGALAAFLLADDPNMVLLKVSTRHIHSHPEDGLEFEAKLTDRPLAIRYIKKETVGTRIEVITSSAPAFMQRSRIDEENLINEWDWYCLDTPRVRRVATSGRELTQRIKLPIDKNRSPDDYHWIEPEGYQSVGWTFRDVPALVCNGIIVVEDGISTPPLEYADTELENTVIEMPSISVFDRNGKLPLTLDRLRVDFERISFLDELRDDVLRNIAAYLVVCAPTDIRHSGVFDSTMSKEVQSHPAIRKSVERISWVLTPHGVSLFEPNFLPQMGVDNIVELKKTTDLDLIKIFTNHNPFAIAITSNSLFKSEDHIDVSIKSAKRGVYRRTLAFSYLDKKRLEYLYQFLCERSHRSRNQLTRRTDWSHEFFMEFKRLVLRIGNYPASIFDQLISSLKNQLQQHGEVTFQMEEAYRRLEKIRSSFHIPNNIIPEIIELIESPNLPKDIEIPADVFRHKLENLLFDVEETLFDQKFMVLEFNDLCENIERQIYNISYVTSQMIKEYQLLKDASKQDNVRLLYRRFKKFAKFLETRHKFYQQSKSRDELNLEIEQILDRFSIKGISLDRMSQNFIKRIKQLINERSKIPEIVPEALKVFKSMNPQEKMDLVYDGEISSSVVDWGDLSDSNLLDEEFTITEYEIDQSVNSSSRGSILSRIWFENIRKIVIPYDLNERKKQLAFLWERDEMKRHLIHWECVLSNAMANSDKS